MSKLSIVVMTHPSRLSYAEQLVAAGPSGARIVTDPEPSGPPTAFRTTMRAWSGVPRDASHHLVIQDDAELGAGFFDHVNKAIELFPEAALSFYANWNSRNGAAVRMAVLSGSRWARAVNEYTPCVALVLPSALASGYVRFAQRQSDSWSEDVLMHRYLRRIGVPTYIAAPNIVNHSELPSIASNSVHGVRRSACFDDRFSTSDCDPACVADLSFVPFLKHGIAQCVSRLADPSGSSWEHIELSRFLGRLGIRDSYLRGRFSDDVQGLDGEDPAWVVWLTAYAMGLAVRQGSRLRCQGHAEPAPELVERALGTVGPGGFCDSGPERELAELHGSLQRLAMRGMEAGGEGVGGARSIPRRSLPRIAVLGDAIQVPTHLARELADLGYKVTVCGGPPASTETRRILGNVEFVLSLAPHAMGELLDVSRENNVKQVIYGSTWRVYEGSARGFVGEGATIGTPGEAEAAAAYHAELECRRRRLEGMAVQILRFAQPFGPGVRHGSALEQLIIEALTGKELKMGDHHKTMQFVHIRDMAGAVDAVLRHQAVSPVLNVATIAFTARELAEAVRRAVRPDGRVIGDTDRQSNMIMSTEMIHKELNWRSLVRIDDSIRAYAQWLAYEGAE